MGWQFHNFEGSFVVSRRGALTKLVPEEGEGIDGLVAVLSPFYYPHQSIGIWMEKRQL